MLDRGVRNHLLASRHAAHDVLHCFQKKTPATPKRDIDLAQKRYQELVKEQQ